MQKANTNIAVYGSLRLGCYNYSRFKNDLKYLGTETIFGFKLFNLGPYPCVVPTGDENDKLVVDLMEATLTGFYSIEGMERGAGYTREPVQINGKEFGIYCFDKSALTRLKDRHVPGGDWVKFLQPVNEQSV